MKDFIHIDDSIVYEYLTNNSTTWVNQAIQPTIKKSNSKLHTHSTSTQPFNLTPSL